MTPAAYRLRLRARVHRQLAGPPGGLPAGVAAAAAEFLVGPLVDNPVSRDARRVVTVLDIAHRADAYGVD